VKFVISLRVEQVFLAQLALGVAKVLQSDVVSDDLGQEATHVV